MRFDAVVEIRGLDGLADPEGQTIERALPALGFGGVSEVHVGKVITLSVDAPTEVAARQEVELLCERLLVNPVIERGEVTLRAVDGAAS